MATGSIRAKGNHWELRFDLPRGADGKRRAKSITFRGKKRDAERELRRILREIDQGTYLDASKRTAGEQLDLWLVQFAPRRVDARVLEDYQRLVRLHLAPMLGTRLLTRLDPDTIQALVTAKEKELSPQRVRSMLCVLRQALRRAVLSRLITWNPCDAVEVAPPKPSAPAVPDAAALSAILVAARGDDLYPGILLAVHTGARLGEICALKWRDVDLAGGSVLIRQSLRRSKATGLAYKLPKNGEVRRVGLGPDAVGELVRHKGEQAAWRLSLGEVWVDEDLVWPRADGTPRDPHGASHAFHHWIRGTDLSPVKFHALRHAHATLMLAAGVPSKVVQTRLGHKTHGVTMDLYAHVLGAQDGAAAVAFEAALGREVEG